MEICDERIDRKEVMRYLDKQGINNELDGYRLLVTIIEKLYDSKDSVGEVLSRVGTEYGITQTQVKGRVRYALAQANNADLVENPSINKFVLKSVAKIQMEM